MTFADIRQEVKSRLNGTRFLSDTRVNKFINDAQQELDRMYCWPYREKSTTGIAPFTISDLDQVEKVINTSQSSSQLTAIDYPNLVETFGDLSTTGTPSYYYIAWPAGSPEIAVYPTSTTDTIGVQYWKVTTDMSLDADTPNCPSQFHGILVDMAVRRAYRAQGMYAQAQEITPAINDQIESMALSLKPGFPESGAYMSSSAQDY